MNKTFKNGIYKDDIVICKDIARQIFIQALIDYDKYTRKKNTDKINLKKDATLTISALGMRDWIKTNNFDLWCQILEINTNIVRIGFEKYLKRIDNGETLKNILAEFEGAEKVSLWGKL